jgi:hypothetical protein
MLRDSGSLPIMKTKRALSSCTYTEALADFWLARTHSLPCFCKDVIRLGLWGGGLQKQKRGRLAAAESFHNTVSRTFLHGQGPERLA